MTLGYYLSPLGTAHYLDATGVALCGRYAPEPGDARPAPADAKPHVKTPPDVTRRNEAIREMRAANPGASNIEIAAAFGVTVTQVRRAVRGTQAGRKPLPLDKIEAIQAARAAGHKIDRISADLGVSRSSVTAYSLSPRKAAS